MQGDVERNERRRTTSDYLRRKARLRTGALGQRPPSTESGMTLVTYLLAKGARLWLGGGGVHEALGRLAGRGMPLLQQG